MKQRKKTIGWKGVRCDCCKSHIAFFYLCSDCLKNIKNGYITVGETHKTFWKKNNIQEKNKSYEAKIGNDGGNQNE